MSPALKQQISSAFAALGHPPLPATLLSQIAALSSSLRLGPSQLAEAWEAHSLTKDVELLDDGTFGGYRTALAKEAGCTTGGDVMAKNATVIGTTGLGKRKSAPGGSNVTPSPAAKRVVATATPGDKAADNGGRSGLSAVDNLVATPSPSGEGGAVSPASKQRRPPGSASSSDATVITPVRRSAAAPSKYSDRANSGRVVASYNPRDLPSALEVLALKSESERERIASHRGCAISRHPASTHPVRGGGGERHMFAPLERRSAALEERLTGMDRAICEGHGIRSEDDEMIDAMDGVVKREKKGEDEIDALWTPVGLPKQNKVLCVGRICNEAHEGRLNRASIRLEGSREHCAGSRIQLDLQGLSNDAAPENQTKQSYSFFPGQIVAVEGINSSGRTMQASRILEGVALPQETMSASQLLDLQYGAEGQNGAPMSIVSMCGPYTTKDNLDYDPLLDAIQMVMTDKPDVVIMCGPFVDGRQPLVAGEDGNGPVIVEDDGIEKTVSHEYLFASKVSTLLEDLYLHDPELKTQFVLVPSLEDAFLDAVYPQPPFGDKKDIKMPKDLAAEFGDLGLKHVETAGRDGARDKRPRRVHCVSNPCTLRINDVTVGVTSTDVLFHISSDECNANLAPGTRLSRIAQHLVGQRSYYPLFPAPRGACSLDLSKSKEWEMPVRPDILIVPSKLASFARLVSDTTVVVNPGELTKNTTGGTYATVDVHPMRRDTLESGMDAGMMEVKTGVQDRVRVDIKRI
mmetsp:Transcript_23933/g.57731  ORF Transcript_23933/g.57731 Transcript_23933/m.57731 type:complete len:747 (-) Transcript_23933:110-2350(-)